MNLYFVYRSPYEPSNKFLKVFQGESILSWFQHQWALFKSAGEEKASDVVREVFGRDVYGIDMLITAIEEEGLRKPASFRKLVEYISDYAYNNEVSYQPGCIQVLTDDDELEMAWYFFDEEYAQAHPEKVAFLLYESASLPEQFGSKSFASIIPANSVSTSVQGEGSIYFIFLSAHAGDNLDPLHGAYKIKGGRMDHLIECVKGASLDKDTPFELRFLQKLIASQSANSVADVFREVSHLPLLDIAEMSWSKPDYDAKDWKGLEGTLNYTPEKSFCNAREHIVQVSIHTGEVFDHDAYDYWIVFDDQWAGANPILANSIIAYAEKWNFLE